MFFDELGINWVYEMEGFDLTTVDGQSIWYLPDFYLPDVDVWIEIKPYLMYTPMNGKSVTILENFGYVKNTLWMVIFANQPTLKGDIAIYMNGVCFGKRMAFGFWHEASAPKNCFSMLFGSLRSRAGLNVFLSLGGETDDVIEMACKAARQARFEHGENGAPKSKKQVRPKRKR